MRLLGHNDISNHSLHRILFSLLCLFGISGDAFAEAIQIPRFIIHLTATIQKDYPGAVEKGQVTHPEEFEEVMISLDRALEVVMILPSAVSHPAKFILDKLNERVRAKAGAKEVTKLASQLESFLLSQFRFEKEPLHRPSLNDGKRYFAEACAACHGTHGDGRGRVATKLWPPATDLTKKREMKAFSSFQIFNVIRFGLVGTAMPAFESYTDEAVWDLAYYVLSLSRNIPRTLAGSHN